MKKITHKIIENIEQIIKYLPIGTNIPVDDRFKEYIERDFKELDVKSIILQKEGKTIANTIIYHDQRKILFFGFFGVLDDRQVYISLLVQKIIEYAKKNQFRTIRGPINIPTIIYGWGFLKRDGLVDLSLAKPVNPPIYPSPDRQGRFQLPLTTPTSKSR